MEPGISTEYYLAEQRARSATGQSAKECGPTPAYVSASPRDITEAMWRWRINAIDRYVERYVARWVEHSGEHSGEFRAFQKPLGAERVAWFLKDAGELARLRATGERPARAFKLYNEWGATLWASDGESAVRAQHALEMEEALTNIGESR